MWRHKYEIGEYVHILPNANEIKPYHDPGFVQEMGKYLDGKYRITDKNTNGYILEGVTDRKSWTWAEEWLEPVDDYDVTETEIDALFGE